MIPSQDTLPHHVRRGRPRRRRDRAGPRRRPARRASSTQRWRRSCRRPPRPRPGRPWRPTDVEAAIVIPAGFTAAVQAGRPAQLLVVGGPSTLPAEVARSVLVGFGSQVTAVQVAVGTVLAGVDGVAGPGARRRELAAAAVAAPAPDHGQRRARRPTGSPRRRPSTARRWRCCSSSSPPSSASSACWPSGATARWRGCSRRPSPRPRSCSARCSSASSWRRSR